MFALVPEPGTLRSLARSGLVSRRAAAPGVPRGRLAERALHLRRLLGVRRPPGLREERGGPSETSIGLLFLVNTAVIIFAQLPIAGLSRGRRRMPTLALFGALWAAAGSSCRSLELRVTDGVPAARRRHGGLRRRAVPARRRRRAARRRSGTTTRARPTWRSTRCRGRSAFALGPALGGSGPSSRRLARAAPLPRRAPLALAVEGFLPRSRRRRSRRHRPSDGAVLRDDAVAATGSVPRAAPARAGSV